LNYSPDLYKILQPSTDSAQKIFPTTRFVCFVYSPRRPENPFNFLRFQKLTPPHRAYCFAIVCTGMRFFKSFKGGETVLGFVSLAAFLIE